MNNDQDPFGQFGAGTSPELAAYPGEGMVLGGRYRLEKVAGQGGMGRVYKALDIDASEVMKGDVHVAIKVLSPVLRKDKRANAALKREALGAQRLTHPNIVRMHGYSTDGPWIFLVMEWLAGSTLDDKLVEAEEQGEQGLYFDEIAPLLQTLAEALDYAHTQGVIHSDIKPANIFMTDEGRVVLVDFGVARQAHARQSRLSGNSASPSGTVEYLPPEAFVGGHKPDARDDVYGLAVTLYELLSGSTPFQGPMVTNRTDKQRPRRPDDLGERQWKMLLHALAVNRNLRPASVGAFVTAMLELANTPEHAPGPHVKEPLRQASTGNSNRTSTLDKPSKGNYHSGRSRAQILLMATLVVMVVGIMSLVVIDTRSFSMPGLEVVESRTEVEPPVVNSSVRDVMIANRYRTHGNGIVTDIETGLIWMRCSVGQKWTGETCDGEALEYDWYEAIQSAQEYQYDNHDDWRLPTLDELHSLVFCQPGVHISQQDQHHDDMCMGDVYWPTIDWKAFPDAPFKAWSSMPCDNNWECAWIVSFQSGARSWQRKGTGASIRLVRGGQ